MPSKQSQRALELMRSNRRLFQQMGNSALGLVDLPDEGVAELNVFGTKARLIGKTPPSLLVWPRRVAADGTMLLHLHGGAYVSGNLLQCRMFFSPFCAAAKLPGVTFAYRLAPDNPYPAALEDAISVYRMVVAGGIRPEKVGLIGESAGGNLALALTQYLRDRGEPLPGALCLLSPWTDLLQTGDSYRSLSEVDATLNAPELMQSALSYAGGDAEKLRGPMLSPIHARFEGFPQTQIHVGESELLLSDAVTLYAAMKRDGAEAQLIRWAGMPHVFQMYGFRESRVSIRAAGAFLARALV